MSSRKQLLVLSTTVPLLMFRATVGVAAQPDFDTWCNLPKGASYGLCRAGVAVGCTDGSGNAQACDNIEQQFYAVAGYSAPWLIPDDACPCDFDHFDLGVAQTSPPWVPSGGTLHCQSVGSMTAIIWDEADPQTVVATGMLNNGSLSCEMASYGNVIENELSSEDVNQDCLRELEGYWSVLVNELPGIDTDNQCGW